MNIYRLTTGHVASNTYVLTKNDVDCVIVDCDDFAAVYKFVCEKGLICRALLLTHAHFDHCNGAAQWQKKDAKVYLHQDDLPLLQSGDNLAESMGEPFHAFTPDVLIHDGDVCNVCGFSAHVLHTPGHTEGSVCYLIDDEMIFSGDTLFYMSVGRTDFPTGDAAALRRSIREKLFTLNKDYIIYPGHDRPTHLFFERENNFYV